MTWDAVQQYSEALSGRIDDWHPPVMQWIWQRLIMVHAGPAPMLLLQLTLYWGGLAIVADAFWNKTKWWLAYTLLACGLLPLGLALTGMILKDSLMTGALLCATGMLALRGDRGHWWLAIIAGILLCFAATLRFNAFLACVPLMVAHLPRVLRRTRPRLLLTVMLATAALIAVMPAADRLIGAKRSGVQLSLVIFDLGGITEQSGVSVFPEELEVPDPVLVNQRCYRPDKWDSYSDWVAPECQLGFTAWNDNVDPAEMHPLSFWLKAILAHPGAYLEHRLNHFAINVRLFPLADVVERPVPQHDAPNIWGYHTAPNRLRGSIDALAVASSHTPLGWPFVWITVALGTLIASWKLPHAQIVKPVALSSIVYGCGYAIFSVASELRYHLWTEIAALIAAVLTAGLGPRHRLLWVIAPVAAAACIGAVLRTSAWS
jgi:hypothetical protein